MPVVVSIEGMEDVGNGKIVKALYRSQRCSDMLQTFVQRPRVVVTTQCSSISTSRLPKNVQQKSTLTKEQSKKSMRVEKCLHIFRNIIIFARVYGKTDCK
jgi:hypothetical protein